MSESLNPTIAAYIEAGNARDVDAFIACFAPDAVVVDENRTRRGADEIVEWFHETRNQYDFKAEIKSYSEGVLVCTVSGNFPGSPVDLSYRFKMDCDKIAELKID